MDYASAKKNKAKPANDAEASLVQQMSQASVSGSQAGHQVQNFGNIGGKYGIQPEANYKKLSDKKKRLVDYMTSELMQGVTYTRSPLTGDYFRDNPTLKRTFKDYDVKEIRFTELYSIARQEYNKIAANNLYKEEVQQVRRDALAEKKRKEASDLERKNHEYLDAIKNIWSTNTAYPVMKSMSAGKAGSISGSAVIAELSKRHGDEQFTGSEGRRIASLLSSTASGMDVKKVKNFNWQIYTNNLKSKPKTYYRGTRVSENVISAYRRAEKGKLFRSSTLMAVSKNMEKAESFMQNTTKSGSPLLITITGFSAEPMSASLVVSSEVESVFSTYATFKFVSFNGNHLVLEETESNSNVEYPLY